jgi:hypothetical protein
VVPAGANGGTASETKGRRRARRKAVPIRLVGADMDLTGFRGRFEDSIPPVDIRHPWPYL